MPAFLDVDLEQVAQVVERRRGLAEVALLLDRGGLGVALDHDQPAQHGAMFARHVLPGRLALVGAERDLSRLDLGREQDAPFVFGHAHVIEFGPALGIDADRGAQIHQCLLESFRPHVVPPIDIAGVPFFQRFLHPRVASKIDVVGDQPVVIDIDDVHAAPPRFVMPRECGAPSSHGLRRPRVRWLLGRPHSRTMTFLMSVPDRSSAGCRCRSA